MAVAEKRTQMYFPQELYQKLQKRAKAESRSVASIVREAVEKYLNEKEVVWEKDPLFSLEGILDSELTDLVENHDRYLYGEKKQ